VTYVDESDNVTKADDSPPVIAGNWLDDDGIVMDDLYRDNGVPPIAKELPTTNHGEVRTAVPVPTRLLSRNYAYNKASGDIIMALPSDANRKRMLIRSDYPIVIASERADLSGECTTAFLLLTTDTVVLMEGHTGAVWVAPYDIAARVIGGASGNYNFTIATVTS
jgi:hypothetical protein